MRNNRDFQGDNFIKKRKIHKYLRRVVALLSAFVLLFTVNTLKRNANTLERIATCGYEEHVHDAGCYDAAGALICGLEEHVHTDACYQAAPTEVEVQLGDEEEQDLPLEDDEASLETENVFVEENPVEEPKVFSLSEPTPVSAIVEAMKLDVDLGRVIEVGAIVDDAEHEGLLDVQPMDGGDWMVSALREFDDAELALVLEDDILIVDLENKTPAQPQEAEIQAEQTEVDPEPTEDGQAIEEQTEVDTVVEEQPGEETPVEEVEADLSEVTADAPETADVEAADENPEITDETAETSDVEATDENNTETTDETAETEPETADAADDANTETSDENPEAADEPSEETSDENPETTDEPSEEAGDEQDVDEAAQDGQAADAEPEETDEATEETSDETADAVEKQPDVSVTVDLSSVDLMGAASVEADTVKLNVADLLNAEDAAVERSGDLTVDTADFVDAATVVAADNVAVEDGVITLTAEAMEAGSVTMALESEDEDAEPQVVEIALSGYTGRVTDEIASDPAVQIVPAEGNSLPADAFAAVKSGDVPQELLDSEAAEDENIVQSAKAYDITITNANEDEISNTGAVEVTLTPSDLDVLADVPETATVNKLDYELYHIHDDGTCEKVEDAVFDVAEDGTLNSVSFTTESFSTYVVKYTVDFTYVDAEGNERFWQFPGSGSHALREVLSELGIEGEAITDASLELTEQVDEAGENDLYLTQDLDTQEYFINSDAPFDDTYTLSVTVDEVVYTIIVTDDQEAVTPYSTEWDVSVNLFERDGSVADTNNLTALEKTTYGVMAVIYDKYEGTPLGYKIIGSQFRHGNDKDNPDGCYNSMSFNFNLSDCKKIAQNENGAWVDAETQLVFNSTEGWIVDADHKYAPKDVDIQFELFEAEDYGGAPDYNRVSVDGWNSMPYQTAYQYARGVTGFDFKPWPNGHRVNASSHTAELNLQRAYTKTYKLRVNTAPTNVGIPHDDYLYALVRLNAGLATEKTGMFHIYFPASNKGETYEFAASEWKKTSIGSSGTNSISNLTFTGDETVEVFLFYKHNSEGNVETSFDDIYSHCIPKIAATSEYSEYKDGDTAYAMEVSLTPIRSVVNNDAAGKTYIYDTINFLTLDPTGSITKSHIDSVLQDARDFGYYTLEYIGHSGDIEATIGADYMNANFLADYGYSQRNVQTNVLKVKKVYLQDGEPYPHQSVTIKLYKTDKDGNMTGEAIETKTGETNDKGILELEFTGLEPGGYTVSEKLGSGPEIFPGSSGQVSGLTTTFSAADVRFVENGNVNYFGTIGYPNNDAGNELLDRMLSKGKRVPLVILTNTQETVTRIENWVSNHSDAYGSGKVSAAVNGTSPYKHYDIPSDMERMRALSHELATATDSKTVRVVNVKASELTEEGLSFSNENRFIVVNVKMDQKAFCPMVRLDGRVLEGDFGRGGKENSTKVLFNLLDPDGEHGYSELWVNEGKDPKEFDTTKTGAGVILAPWANAHELGGVFGGTIVSMWVNRMGNEIHSDNPNQRQNLNITIQNEEGTPKVGMLELRKEYPENSNIKDRITYFPFKVKLTNSEQADKVQEKSFPASGLKDDESEVTFDANGEATVWVRADNSVTIANLPAGTTYTVTEELTEDLAKLYTFVGAKGNNSGTIKTRETESVTLINDVPRSGLTLKKVVQGTDATDVDFHFELYLWQKDGDNPITAFTDTSNSVTAKKNNVAVDNFSFRTEGVEYDDHDASVYAFTLKANEQLVVDGLPQGVNYAFVELTDKTHMPAGYQVVTPNGKVTGTLPTDNVATITNNKLTDIEVQKSWKGGTAPANAQVVLQLFKTTMPIISTPTEGSDPTPAAYADEGAAVTTIPITSTGAVPPTGGTPVGEPITLDGTVDAAETAAWYHKWTNLPIFEDGHMVYYYVAEQQVTGIDAESITANYTNTTQKDGSYSHITRVDIENDVTYPQLTSITVTKKWSDNVWPENVSQVQVTLKANGSDANVNAETNGNAATVTLTENDNSKTWVHLPMKDDNDQVIVYTVEETSATIDGVVYTQTGDKKLSDVFIIQVSPANVSNVESASVEVTNTYITATPNVVKLIDGKAFNGKLNGEDISFDFTISQISPVGQTYEKTVTSASDGSVTFPAIVYTTAGTYMYEIRETVVANDTRVSYVSTPLYWLVIVEEKDGKLVKTKDNYHSINTCTDPNPEERAVFNNHELTYVDIVKQWCLNAGDASDEYPSGEPDTAPTVKVYLRRKTVGSDDDKIIDADHDEADIQPFTVPYDETEEKWYLHIPGLEKYDKNGNAYQYYIVEDASNMQGWTPILYKAQNKEELNARETGTGGASTNTVTGEGTLTVVNSMSQVALPATGGVGTGVIYAAGAGLLALALAWWLARMRKRDYDA